MPISDETLRSLFSIPDQTAIVTGAASGIGKAIAGLMAKAGAKIVIADLNLADARAVADAIVAGGSEAMAVKADVSQENRVAHMVAEAVAAFGGVDILVNNAAYRPKADHGNGCPHLGQRARGERPRHVPVHARSNHGDAQSGPGTGWGDRQYLNNRPRAPDDIQQHALRLIQIRGEWHHPYRCRRVCRRWHTHQRSHARRRDHRRFGQDAGRFRRDGPDHDAGPPAAGHGRTDAASQRILFLPSPASSYMIGHVMAVDGGYLVG